MIRVISSRFTARQEVYFRCILAALKGPNVLTGAHCRISYFTPYGHFTALPEPHDVLAFVVEQCAECKGVQATPRRATMLWGVDSFRKAMDGPIYVARELLQKRHDGHWALAALPSGPIPLDIHPLEIVSIEGGPAILTAVAASTWASPCFEIWDPSVCEILNKWFDDVQKQGITLNPLEGDVTNKVDILEFERHLLISVASEPLCFFPPQFKYRRTDEDWSSSLFGVKLLVSDNCIEILDNLQKDLKTPLYFSVPLGLSHEVLDEVATRLHRHLGTIWLRLIATDSDQLIAFKNGPLSEFPENWNIGLAIAWRFGFPLAEAVQGSGYSGLLSYYREDTIGFLTKNVAVRRTLYGDGGIGTRAFRLVSPKATERKALLCDLAKSEDEWFYNSVPIELRRFGRLFDPEVPLRREETRLMIASVREDFERLKASLSKKGKNLGK